jgi:PAS domain S-box-containing protein
MQYGPLQNSIPLSDAQTILDSITDAFFSLNSDWEFSYVNRQTEKTLGFSSNELLGRSLWEVFPGTLSSEFEKMYRKAAREQVALAFSAYYPDHDRWYEVNVYPTAGGLSVYFRDITQRMREETLRHALFRLSDIFRDLNSPEEIIFEASAILGKALEVSRVGYGTIDASAETLHVERDWNAAGVETLAGVLRLRDYGSFIDDLKDGRFISIDDVEQDSRTASSAAALKARSAAAFVNVPVIEQNKLVAVIFINHATSRHWSPEELEFIRDVAERARAASERARTAAALNIVIAESERRRRLYETFLENSPDLAYVFDLNYRFTYANKILLDIWGRTWEESIGKNCLELGYEPWHAEMHQREIDQVIASKQPVRGEVPFEGTLGRRIYEYIFVPVLGPDGEVEAIAGTTRDITERNQAVEALRDADRRKDEFLAMLAHELRNPLAPISAAAELLQMDTLDEKMTKRASQIINRQVKHMTALVDDLLDVSRVTRGLVSLTKSALDMKSVVYGAVEQVRPFIETQRHHLLVDLSPETAFVMGDQKRLVQIVTNLLNNAAKYTPAGGEIRIRLSVAQDMVTLMIEDNGVGMPAQLLPHVFELFIQAERTPDRVQGGLGIGLALVKNLTELHGGSIEAYSEGSAKGSRFTVHLPRHHAASDKVFENTETAPDFGSTERPLQILVVDDNFDAAQMLCIFLERQGHHVAIEHAAHSAFARAKRERPDVCILDIGLPDMDGNELARELKADRETDHAVLIALTGYGTESDKLAARAAGFDHYLVKPVDVGRLTALLEQNRTGLSTPLS